MSNAHLRFWPEHALPHLDVPATNLFYNAEVSAHRYPDKPSFIFYDTPISFAELHAEAKCLAGFLEQRCGVKAGDRVMLFMQNSPQFVLGNYAILRANAVVVPLNPMYQTHEVLRVARDAVRVTFPPMIRFCSSSES